MLVADQDPVNAIRQGADRSICGDCVLRGDHGSQRSCYVEYWRAPQQIYQSVANYPSVAPAEAAALVEARPVRLTTYGDPAAIPFEIWQPFVQTEGAEWTGYTHAWRTCDPRFKTFCMASVETEADQRLASEAGWRTFRAMRADEQVGSDEVLCPASEEAGYTTTCSACQLCQGTETEARSVAIYAHGSKTAFWN